jgi:hypothetical protein
MTPVNHYCRLPDIIIVSVLPECKSILFMLTWTYNFIWENAARYNLQAYSDNDVIRAQINREISSILSDVKGTIRTTVCLIYLCCLR